MARELILGVETSCDDTSAAVVAPDGTVHSSLVVSQADLHTQFGGVWPEVASRAHIAKVIPAVKEALAIADVRAPDLHSIAVTRGPGLIGSLMVGVDTARALGLGWHLPVNGINHLRGHLRSADLEEQRVRYPAVVLLVSGGHTLLAFMKATDSIELVGSTLDDSVGEAYDKVARMLGLGYPGGPVVDRLAREGVPRYPLPRPMMQDPELRKTLNFSFSGLKTAVRNLIERTPEASKADVAASFVEACMDVLLFRARACLERFRPRSFVVVGGVAASPQLRERTTMLCDELGVSACLPPVKWSTDNAAMIALAGWDYVRAGAPVRLAATSVLSMESF